MRLLRVEVENFLTFDKAVLQFHRDREEKDPLDSGSLATIVGPNGSGKSNIIRVVEYCIRNYAPGKQVALRPEQRVSQDSPTYIRMIFTLTERERNQFAEWRRFGIISFLNADEGEAGDAFRQLWFEWSSKMTKEDESEMWNAIDQKLQAAHAEVAPFTHAFLVATTTADCSKLDFGFPTLRSEAWQREVLVERELKAIEDALSPHGPAEKHLDDLRGSLRKVLGSRPCFLSTSMEQLAILKGRDDPGVRLQLHYADRIRRWQAATTHKADPVAAPYSTSEVAVLDTVQFQEHMVSLLQSSVAIVPQDRGLLDQQLDRKSADKPVVFNLKRATDMLVRRAQSRVLPDREIVRKVKAMMADLFPGIEFDVITQETSPGTTGATTLVPTIAFQVNNNPYFLPVENVSGGYYETLIQLTALFASDADTVLLDEPGSGLHPPLKSRFVELIYDHCVAANGTQPKSVLIVTHSPAFLMESLFFSLHHQAALQDGKSSMRRLRKEVPPPTQGVRKEGSTGSKKKARARAKSASPARGRARQEQKATFADALVVETADGDDGAAADGAVSAPASSDPGSVPSAPTPDRRIWPLPTPSELPQYRVKVVTQGGDGWHAIWDKLLRIFGANTVDPPLPTGTGKPKPRVVGVDIRRANGGDRVYYLTVTSRSRHDQLISTLENIKSDPMLTARQKEFYYRPHLDEETKDHPAATKNDAAEAEELRLSTPVLEVDQKSVTWLLGSAQNLLFSTGVVFVEGKNDFRFLQALQYALRQRLVTGRSQVLTWEVIPLHGCGNTKRAVQLAWELQVPHVIVFDSDALTGAVCSRGFPDRMAGRSAMTQLLRLPHFASLREKVNRIAEPDLDKRMTAFRDVLHGFKQGPNVTTGSCRVYSWVQDPEHLLLDRYANDPEKSVSACKAIVDTLVAGDENLSFLKSHTAIADEDRKVVDTQRLQTLAKDMRTTHEKRAIGHGRPLEKEKGGSKLDVQQLYRDSLREVLHDEWSALPFDLLVRWAVEAVSGPPDGVPMLLSMLEEAGALAARKY